MQSINSMQVVQCIKIFGYNTKSPSSEDHNIESLEYKESDVNFRCKIKHETAVLTSE
jgi:hypothetical protein